jgi:hypothetical protein
MEVTLEREETSRETEEIESGTAKVLETGEGTEETTQDPKLEEVPKKTGTEETEPEKVEAQVFDIDGEKLTAEQVKEMKDAWKNKQDWTKDFTQKSQVAADERRKVEADKQRLQEAMFIQQKLHENPDLLKQVFAPKPTRDWKAEEAQIWSQRPIDINSQEYVNWEYARTNFYREQDREEVQRNVFQKQSEQTAKDHNERITLAAWEKYSKDGVAQDDFVKMADWIRGNLKETEGRFPKESFEIAFSSMFPDRQIRKEKLDATKKASEAIVKAKPADGVKGAQQTTENDMSDDDTAFIAEMRARNRRS